MARYSDGSYYDSADNSGYSGSGTARSYAMFHGQGDDEEDEDLQRQIQLMEAQGRERRSYALFDQDIKSAARDRDMRQGIYSSPEQMAMDEFGPMYEPKPYASGAGIHIGESFGPDMQAEGPPAPMLRRTMRPDAQKQMDVFRKTGGQNGIPIDEFRQREEIKAQQRMAVAKQVNDFKAAATASGQKFDLATIKARILGSNPGGVDPVVLDEVLAGAVGPAQATQTVNPAPTAEAPVVDVAPKTIPDRAMIERLKKKYPGRTEQQIIAALQRQG